MFDIGFWEMALIAVVALLVVGPKELPALLRGVSSWVSKARKFANEFRTELSREAARAEELKKLVEREAEISELQKLLDESRKTIPIDSPHDDKDQSVTGSGGGDSDGRKPDSTQSGQDRDGRA